jgi:hypothetical protein
MPRVGTEYRAIQKSVRNNKNTSLFLMTELAVITSYKVVAKAVQSRDTLLCARELFSHFPLPARVLTVA